MISAFDHKLPGCALRDCVAIVRLPRGCLRPIVKYALNDGIPRTHHPILRRAKLRRGFVIDRRGYPTLDVPGPFPL
jgi:hypothetical protein